MFEMIALPFLFLSGLFVGGWIYQAKMRKVVKRAALSTILEYYKEDANEVDNWAWTLLNQRKLYPKGRGRFSDED